MAVHSDDSLHHFDYFFFFFELDSIQRIAIFSKKYDSFILFDDIRFQIYGNSKQYRNWEKTTCVLWVDAEWKFLPFVAAAQSLFVV